MNSRELEEEVQRLEAKKESYLERFDSEKNTSVSGEKCLEPLLFQIVQLCCRIQRKTIELIERYEVDIETIDDMMKTKSASRKKVVNPKKKKKNKRRESYSFLTDENFSSYENTASSLYFRSNSDRFQHDNEDLVDIQTSGYKFVRSLRAPRVWLQSDRDQFLNAVLQYKKRNNLKELTELYHALQTTNDEGTILSIMQRANSLTKSVTGDPITDDSLELIDGEEVDWNLISKMCFRGRRRPEELKAMWTLVVHPDVRTKKWTQAEDILLRCLALENDFQDWEHINELMPTPRNGFLCFSRYVSIHKWKNVNVKRVSGRYYGSTIENIGSSSQSKPIPYSGRSSNAMIPTRKRKYNDVVPGKKRGEFSKREKFVVYNYLRRGYSYQAVASMLKNRSAKQICEHFNSSIRRQNVSSWTPREDSRLMLGVKYFGAGNWRAISRFMDNRIPDQCRLRFLNLLKRKREHVEAHLNGKFETPKMLHRNIKKFLHEKPVKNHINKEVENYFLLQLDRNVQRKRKRNHVADDVLRLLRFLNFELSSIPRDDEFNQWLVNYPSEWKYGKLFSEEFARMRKKQRSWPVKTIANNIFSHAIYRFKVLPPNKSGIYGLNTFMENYQSYFEKNANIDFGTLWKNENDKNCRKPYFNESKMLWYAALRAMLFWPLKLKTIIPADLVV